MCKEFAAEWLVPLFLRNLVLLWCFAGGWHLMLCAHSPPAPAPALQICRVPSPAERRRCARAQTT